MKTVKVIVTRQEKEFGEDQEGARKYVKDLMDAGVIYIEVVSYTPCSKK